MGVDKMGSRRSWNKLYSVVRVRPSQTPQRQFSHDTDHFLCVLYPFLDKNSRFCNFVYRFTPRDAHFYRVFDREPKPGSGSHG